MTKEEIKIKLDAVLGRLGMNVTVWPETVSYFLSKLELLSDTSSYNELLKSLFASNDLSEFNSYVFEVMFAYDFESKQQSLSYEINQLSSENSSIDFYYRIDNIKIYFELRLIQQRNWITSSIETQLSANKSSKTLLNGDDETDETIRIQNLILSKCQKSDGKPTKFHTPENDTLNFIVINISELHLGMIDKFDCLLTMYGDVSVPLFFRRGIFGMWQDLPKNSSEIERRCHGKFQHFRETIHGIFFVRYVKGSGHLNKMYIDRELEYFAILNNNLLQKETVDHLLAKLASFLTKWSDNASSPTTPPA